MMMRLVRTALFGACCCALAATVHAEDHDPLYGHDHEHYQRELPDKYLQDDEGDEGEAWPDEADGNGVGSDGLDDSQYDDDTIPILIDKFYLTLDAVMLLNKGNETELLMQLKAQYPDVPEWEPEMDEEEEGEETEPLTERDRAQYLLETVFHWAIEEENATKAEQLTTALQEKYGAVIQATAEEDEAQIEQLPTFADGDKGESDGELADGYHDLNDYMGKDRWEVRGKKEGNQEDIDDPVTISEPKKNGSGDVCQEQPSSGLASVCTQLKEFYLVHGLPEKARQLNRILFRYKGREQQLLADIKAKYDGNFPSPPGVQQVTLGTQGNSITTAADVEKAVRQLYSRYDPSKLTKVPSILFRYKGRETQLLADLHEKYGKDDDGAAAKQRAPRFDPPNGKQPKAKEKKKKKKQTQHYKGVDKHSRQWTTASAVQVTVMGGPTAAECEPQNLSTDGKHVRIHYTGYVLQGNGGEGDDASSKGKQYHTSVGGAATEFQLGGDDDGVHWVIAGWEDGLANVCKGAKLAVIVPPEQAYGDEGNVDEDNGWGDVPPDSTLYFEVELISVQDSSRTGGAAGEAVFSLGLHDGPMVPCTGDAVARKGSKIALHFTGKIDESSQSGIPEAQFASSKGGHDGKGGGAPFEFTLGDSDAVIPGWNEALLGLCTGHKGTMVVPPMLGYGDEGLKATGEWGEVDVPSGATLFYEIELVSIQNDVAAGDY